MNFQIAEMARKGDVLFLRQVLIAKEDHAVFEQRGANFGNSFFDVGRAKIDVVDLCANGGRHRPDIERSGIQLSAFKCSCHVSLPCGRVCRVNPGLDQAAWRSSSLEPIPNLNQRLGQLVHHRFVNACGPGVKRRRSVPRGTVGKLIGCT